MEQHTQRITSVHASAQHRAGKARRSKVSEGMLFDRSVCSMAWPGITWQRMGWHIVVKASISTECNMFDRALSGSPKSQQRLRQGSALHSHSKDGSCCIVLSFGGKDVYDAWRAVGLSEQAHGGGVKEAYKEARFDWGWLARHGIIEMYRSGTYDVVQVATHICSQGGVRHIEIIGGGISCLKALPDLPQQGKREAELIRQQIVLRLRVKVNVDMGFKFICRQVASSA